VAQRHRLSHHLLADAKHPRRFLRAAGGGTHGAVRREWNREAVRIKAGGESVRGRPVRGRGEQQQEQRREEEDAAAAWQGERPPRRWHADCSALRDDGRRR
jgi:hypothetical protein